PKTTIPPTTTVTQKVANLRAFALLYGAVRWFHPSDIAAVTDWDRFAVEGARQVGDAIDTQTLHARLVELFTPIAPTVQIIGPGESFRHDSIVLSLTGLEIVAWQHEGYGDSSI